MPPLSLNRPHLCPPKPTTWLVHWSCSNDFPGQVNSCPSRARCSAFMDRWCEPRLPKKKKSTAVGWSRSGRGALLSQPLLRKADFLHTLAQRFGNDSIGNNQIDSRASLCISREVESWTRTVQKLACRLRESTAMQTVQGDGGSPCAPSAGPTRFASTLFFCVVPQNNALPK